MSVTCGHQRQPHPYKREVLLPCAWPGCWAGVVGERLHLSPPWSSSSAWRPANSFKGEASLEVWVRRSFDGKAGPEWAWMWAKA